MDYPYSFRIEQNNCRNIPNFGMGVKELEDERWKLKDER